MAKTPRKSTQGKLTNPHDKFFKEILSQPDLATSSPCTPNISRLHEAPHRLNVWQAFGKLENQSAVQYIRVMLKYASEANTTLTKDEVLDSIEQSFTKRGEKVMAPFVEEWRQEGREQGIQIGLQQGLHQGVTETILRQLERKVGRVTIAQKKTITKLPMPKLTKLSDDLLDFQAAEDLKRWLRQNAA